jgi:hypothetical protein
MVMTVYFLTLLGELKVRDTQGHSLRQYSGQIQKDAGTDQLYACQLQLALQVGNILGNPSVCRY